MFTVWLEQFGTNVLKLEEQLLMDYFKTQPDKFEIVYLGSKQINKTDLPDKLLLASGTIGFVKSALRKFNKELPIPNDYPDFLKHHLHRDIQEIKFSELNNTILPRFIKPSKNV